MIVARTPASLRESGEPSALMASLTTTAETQPPGDRADESHGEVVAQNRAGGEEHQNAAHDNDREAKHHGLPLGNELLEVKKRSHIDDEDAGHHIGNGDKAGIGEQSRRNSARPEQDQERDRGEEQYGDDGVRFVGNEVADREYNTHDRQG